MQEFSWKARSQNGKLLRGKVRASSEREAVALIKNSYGFVVELKPQERNFWKHWLTKLSSKKLKFSDKQSAVFFKQLAVILNSGVPLLQGLDLLRQRTDVVIGKVCAELSGNLQKGTSLASAMQQCGKAFSNLAITLVAAGERSGELDNVLLEIASYYAKQSELKEFLYKATLYPLFLLIASLSVLCFFLAYVLPMLASVYSSLGAKPNELLQFAVSVNNFLSVYGFEVCLVLLVIFLYIYHSRQQLVLLCLSLPLVRNLHAMVLEIRFCKLLGLLLDKGINITDAVEVATATISHK